MLNIIFILKILNIGLIFKKIQKQNQVCIPSDLKFRSALQNEKMGSLFRYLLMLVETFASKGNGIAVLQIDISYFCNKILE